MGKLRNSVCERLGLALTASQDEVYRAALSKIALGAGLTSEEVRLLDSMGSKGWTLIEVVSGRGPDGGTYRNVGAGELRPAQSLQSKGYARIVSQSDEVRQGRYYTYYTVEMTTEGKKAWYAHYGHKG